MRLCFSLFFTTNHQKGQFFVQICTLDLDPRLQPQNPTHYIGKPMEMFNLVLQFPLIPQWNVEQDASRSMRGSDLQLVPTFFEDDFFRSVFF